MANTLAREVPCEHRDGCSAIRHRIVEPESRHARWLREDIAAGFRCWILYRFYDRTGQLLYAGITTNSIERWRSHSYARRWWSRVHRIEFVDYATEQEARAAERHAIRTESPFYNVSQAVG